MYMVLGSLTHDTTHLLTHLFLKPIITFGCSGTLGCLKINRVYVTRISKGNSDLVYG